MRVRREGSGGDVTRSLGGGDGRGEGGSRLRACETHARHPRDVAEVFIRRRRLRRRRRFAAASAAGRSDSAQFRLNRGAEIDAKFLANARFEGTAKLVANDGHEIRLDSRARR